MHVLITGGSSVVGDHLLPRLSAAGHEVTVLSRRPAASPQWRRLDVAREPVWPVVPEGISHLVHLAPLPLLASVLRGAPRSLRRVVAIGTTSVFTKSESPSAKDRRLVQDQRRAEEGLIAFCAERGIGYALFRPTLVYDGRRDKNVARIAALIRRLHFFPVAAPAAGLRQPLHADDLAAACVAALVLRTSGSYELAGGERLTYRAMVERIFVAQGQKPHVLPLPVALYRSAIRLAKVLPRFREVTPEVADRMNQDMVFDYSAATRDLGFRPREFAP
ncbi:MAG TPA: SDR family oxidoreductase [Gammaproteobacteria bacterium]|nr:SDR family oxidoreductase [Gammaproteobacteria bacterium]